MKQSGISQDYFNAHIRIHSADGASGWPGLLNIKYYFSVGWVTILDSDQIRLNSEADENSNIQKIARSLNRPIESIITREISLNHPIESIISRSEAEPIFKKQCDPRMNFDPTRAVSFNKEGQLTIEGQVIIDDAKNVCKKAQLNLESGELLSCQEIACRIY